MDVTSSLSQEASPQQNNSQSSKTPREGPCLVELVWWRMDSPVGLCSIILSSHWKEAEGELANCDGASIWSKRILSGSPSASLIREGAQPCF